ncbi:MAG: hypothetical protein WBE61_12615 [Nitrososphaeraceae archaeon]
MGSNTPRQIKVEVIRRWLQGKRRDEIAKEEGIGAGTVSSIINECRQNDSEFDLIRQAAVKLKNQGESIESFAPLVRLREMLRRELFDKATTTVTADREGKARGEDEDDVKMQQLREELELENKLESLLVALEVFCFKQNLWINDFVDVIYQLCRGANILGIPLENLPDYLKRLENTVLSLQEEIKEKRSEKEEALEDYDVTLELLEEYKANRPLFEENKKLRERLDKVRQQRDDYARELMDERFDKVMDEYNNCWIPDN